MSKLIDPGKDKAIREDRKDERMKSWKKPSVKDINPDTGKKYTKTAVEKKVKELRDSRIQQAREVYGFVDSVSE